ncbi:hypothetical protein MTO96_011364 [Rhipicephalus appendiculatus]
MTKTRDMHTIATDCCWTLAPLSVLSALLAVLISKNSAIFYVAFMEEFGVSHQSASWPATLCVIMVQSSGLLVSLLQKKLSIYHIAIGGSLLNFVALIGASFAPNIIWMDITLGILSADGQVAATVFGLLRSPTFYLLVPTFGLIDYIANTFETTVLDYAEDKGASESQALPIVTYVAAAEIAGRLTLPFIWDSLCLCRRLLVALCLLGASACFVAMPHVTALGNVIATAVTTGITTGCVTAMKPVLLSDSLGVSNLSFCWGVSGIVALPLHVAGPMLIGEYHIT